MLCIIIYKKQFKRPSKGSVRYDGTTQSRILALSEESPMASSPLHYGAALASPLVYSSGEARIPDMILIPTQTMSFQLETTLFNDGNGNNAGMLQLTSQGPRFFTATGAGVNPDPWLWSGTGGVRWSVDPSAAATSWSNTIGLLTGWRSLAVCNGARVVAAGLQVEFLGNDQNNQGLITGAMVSSSDMQENAALVNSDASGSTGGQYFDQTRLENSRFNYSGPMKKGLNLHWYPIDTADMEFGTTPISTTSALSLYNTPFSSRLITGGTASGDGTGAIGARNYGGLQFATQGGVALAAALRVTIKVHYETLVRTVNDGQDQGEICVFPEAVPASTMHAAKLPQGPAKSVGQSQRDGAKAAEVVAKGIGIPISNPLI